MRVEKKRSGNMAQPTTKDGGVKLLERLAFSLTEEELSDITGKCDKKGCAKVFGNAELVETCYRLFENDFNVKKTAGDLYMHRNTLSYKMRKVNEATGLDVCTFDGAIAFVLLRSLYLSERNGKIKSGDGKLDK